MTYKEWTALEERVRGTLDEERYHHTSGVMYTAAALAMAHGADVEKAMLAGLLHDCAKCIPNEEKPRLCEKYGVEFSEFERQNPHLLHGKLGAYLAKTEYGVADPDICAAIEYHTTGRPDMSLLEQIVFIADYIEPDRNEAKRLELIRRTAFSNLDECTMMIMSDTLKHLNEAGKPIDETTQKAYDFYKERIFEFSN